MRWWGVTSSIWSQSHCRALLNKKACEIFHGYRFPSIEFKPWISKLKIYHPIIGTNFVFSHIMSHNLHFWAQQLVHEILKKFFQVFRLAITRRGIHFLRRPVECSLLECFAILLRMFHVLKFDSRLLRVISKSYYQIHILKMYILVIIKYIYWKCITNMILQKNMGSKRPKD